MERVRVWAGMPSEGAVERLSVICAKWQRRAHALADAITRAPSSDSSPSFARSFGHALTRDAATDAFLMRASRRPYLVNWGQAAACTLLRKFMSLTDANAVLGRGKMHVLSEAHVADLLGGSARDARRDAAPATSLKNTFTGKKKVLLDVGAGEGEVTEKFRTGGGFDVVVATEASAPMVRRLRQKAFDVVLESTDVSTVSTMCRGTGGAARASEDGFDCVALLNVLDRCDAPRTLLRQLRELLKDDGGVLLAVVSRRRCLPVRGGRRRDLCAPREALGLDPERRVGSGREPDLDKGVGAERV